MNRDAIDQGVTVGANRGPQASDDTCEQHDGKEQPLSYALGNPISMERPRWVWIDEPRDEETEVEERHAQREPAAQGRWPPRR